MNNLPAQTLNFNSHSCQGRVIIDKDMWHITVEGTVRSPSDHKLRYIAAAPPDRRASYMGSALPFANEEMAYDSTPNKGEIELNSRFGSGVFSFQLVRPNAYYRANGSQLIMPHVQFSVGTDVIDVPLGLLPYPHRSLSSLPGQYDRSTHR